MSEEERVGKVTVVLDGRKIRQVARRRRVVAAPRAFGGFLYGAALGLMLWALAVLLWMAAR